MRQATLILNSIVIVFFTCFLACTLIAREHLNSRARAFVTEKTVEYATPLVEAAQMSVDSHLAKPFFSKEQQDTIRQEIASFQVDPNAYVANVTSLDVRRVQSIDAPSQVQRVAAVKQSVREFYNSTLDDLVIDLRIVSISNILAGMLAFSLTLWNSSVLRTPIVCYSFMVFFTVVFCTWMYIDDLSFFRILFRLHLGWWYAVLLFATSVALYGIYGRPLFSKH